AENLRRLPLNLGKLIVHVLLDVVSIAPGSQAADDRENQSDHHSAPLTVLGMPGMANERQAIDRQDHNGADHRHDEPGRLSRLIHTEGSADPAAEQGSDDAEYDRHDHAAWVPTRHDELRNDANDEAEHDPNK